MASIVDIPYAVQQKIVKGRRERNVWVKGWIGERGNHGAYNSLICDTTFVKYDYRNFMRMDSDTFHTLLETVRRYIEGKTTNMRKPIPAKNEYSRSLVTVRSASS